MTNQESIECTCRVETWGLPGEVGQQIIIHGPCHSPGPEVWEVLLALVRKHGAFCKIPNGGGPCAAHPLLDDGRCAVSEARRLLSTRKEKV